ncbi:MAG: hypothetical protein EOO28_06210 [Comamonadaceae bacterium]|nr:MAG: hypothetical protein EOO28_06210 [Comamonadaceae bacterium]
MVLLLLEALGALLLLVFIVWWTMFSGRKNGELKIDPGEEAGPSKVADPAADIVSERNPSAGPAAPDRHDKS